MNEEKSTTEEQDAHLAMIHYLNDPDCNMQFRPVEYKGFKVNKFVPPPPEVAKPGTGKPKGTGKFKITPPAVIKRPVVKPAHKLKGGFNKKPTIVKSVTPVAVPQPVARGQVKRQDLLKKFGGHGF